MNNSAKQVCLYILRPRGKNIISIISIKTIKTITAQWLCGFQRFNLWKMPILEFSVIQLFTYSPSRLFSVKPEQIK